MRDDRERDRRGEDADAIGERAREQEDARRGAPRRPAEAMLQALVGSVLRALEIAGQEERGDADATDKVPERDL